MDTTAHDLLCLGTLYFLVCDTTLLFLLLQCRSLVESVVAAKVKDEDVLLWINTRSSDPTEDRMLATVDGLVLVIHDRTGSSSCIISEVTSESRNSWDHDDDSEFPAFLTSTNTSICDCGTDLVVDRCLLFTSSGDEELIFNVDEMFCATNDLTVSVLNALFGENAAGPVGRTAH